MRSREEIEKRIEETFTEDDKLMQMYSDGIIEFDKMYAKHYANGKVREALKWVLEEK